MPELISGTVANDDTFPEGSTFFQLFLPQVNPCPACACTSFLCILLPFPTLFSVQGGSHPIRFLNCTPLTPL